ncbi:hypothetical protein JKP88DRAFT_215153 [Tribonema minus]|uniref:AN1-type domain-containing protein n=1 Tax=Tribonema minus TaxID=303371 RepID=A0A836CDM0_9STRA|nr:hypothetical protein JKP88DRAFT_215153 [Tribonema minus]
MEVQRPSADSDVIKDLRKVAGAKGDAAPPAEETAVTTASAGKQQEQSPPGVQKNRSRCYNCSKKVGLTGLECKCGYVFCSKHRYPEEHSCSYDFRASDRAQLAKTVVGGGQFIKVAQI